jgi:hypothetical protein
VQSDLSLICDPRDLGARCIGTVVTPGDEGWDAARQPWNLAVDQRPAAVAFPHDVDDVCAVVSYARERDMRVAVQATGHGAAALAPLENTILLRTSRMIGVEIDPLRRRARVRPGTPWQHVVRAAGEHGLAALAGSSPSVGVVGDSLGGGIGWLSRKYGLQANSITAIELLAADGSFVRAGRDREPELFWALRGGGGNFGIVTAMEFALYPVAAVTAGALVWDWHESERVLERWAAWAIDAPDGITTSARILRLPPFPSIPAPLRGRQIVMIDGAFTGGSAAAHAALAPLRELRPELDTFAPMPTSSLVHLHGVGRPDSPTGSVSDHALLDGLTPAAVTAFVAVAGPGSSSPLVAAELRQLGGGLRRAPVEHGAMPTLEAAFALLAVGAARDAETGAAVEAHAHGLTEVMAPWSSQRSYLNFAGRPTDTRTAFDAESHRRLEAVRAQVDPTGLLLANHSIDVKP